VFSSGYLKTEVSEDNWSSHHGLIQKPALPGFFSSPSNSFHNVQDLKTIVDGKFCSQGLAVIATL
jgi:hypothetical protein